MATKVLCVDDESDIASLLGTILRMSGYEPLLAGTAAEALELLRARPSLVILDINLPDLDGIECCRLIRRIDATVPVLFLTATSTTRQAEAAAAGGDGFLQKPFDLDHLLDTIARLVSTRHERRAGAERRRRCQGARSERRRSDRRACGSPAGSRDGFSSNAAESFAALSRRA